MAKSFCNDCPSPATCAKQGCIMEKIGERSMKRAASKIGNKMSSDNKALNNKTSRQDRSMDKASKMLLNMIKKQGFAMPYGHKRKGKGKGGKKK